ncbi:hypothetical protein PG997_006956 [Apiospora hydei]|uniref:Uncharacterized protein n=1 Tax=Apiospora hydei TaxID=1337664 RepID=A0ABR1WRZ0_9PEZI
MYDDDPPYSGRGEPAPTRSGSTRHAPVAALKTSTGHGPRRIPRTRITTSTIAVVEGHATPVTLAIRAPRTKRWRTRGGPEGRVTAAPAGGSGRGGEAAKKERTIPPWAKKAGGLLVSTAVPIIKQEGEKYLRKEMERRLHNK